MEMIGMVLLFLMIIADTIRAFKDDDGFDGVMLLVRPIVVLAVALLCGEPFWVALLWAIGWGILGFIISILLSEYLGAVLNENNVVSAASSDIQSSIDNEIVALTSIIINKIACRYPSGISYFISDNYTHIEFLDFDAVHNRLLRKVLDKDISSMEYDRVLGYYGDLSEREVETLRRFGKMNGLGEWEIELHMRNTNRATIAKVRDILEHHPDTVCIVIDHESNASRCSAYIEPNKGGTIFETQSSEQQDQFQAGPSPTRSQSAASKYVNDQGCTSILLKKSGDGFAVCPSFAETDGIYRCRIDYEDGKIFVDWKDGAPAEIIGYYEKTVDPVCVAKVFDASKKRVIGKVGNELIIFRAREADPVSGRYNPEEECLAYYSENGRITAPGLIQTLGIVEGSEIGGAAAFLAAIYAYELKSVCRDFFEMEIDEFRVKHHSYLHPLDF